MLYTSVIIEKSIIEKIAGFKLAMDHFKKMNHVAFEWMNYHYREVMSGFFGNGNIFMHGSSL